MTSALLRMVAVAVVVGCVTCECGKGKKSVAVLTYNTGMAPTVPGYDTRRGNVINALKEIDFDFACLQEVWFANDMQRILANLENTTPHHFSAIHQAPDTLQGYVSQLHSCTDDEVRAVVLCVRHNCSSKPPAEKKSCTMDKCRDEVYSVTQTCRTCITVAGSLFDAAIKCLSTPIRFNTPGLLVLSKQPMSDVKFVDYHDGRKVLLQRGYIQAQVDNLTFVCTHLTSVFPYFYDVNMADLYKDYEKMQRAEIDKLWEVFNSRNHVLMGDLNTGPVRNESGQPYIKGEAKENYNYLTCNLQYFNPYVRNLGLCTYCNSDNSATWEDHKEDAIVDHVLLFKNVHPTSTESERTFTQNKGRLSDHYGVKLSMCLA